MATIRIAADQTSIHDRSAVGAFLARHGIDYDRWTPDRPLDAASTADDVLRAYATGIDALKAQGGYRTADVIDVTADTPNLDAMLAKFSREHWHDEDEVRFIIEGRGLFHIHGSDDVVFAIEVEAGDLIRVPRGTRHWFDLCGERRIRAIRLFQDTAGWTPHYTESGIDRGFEPVCFGPSFVGAALQPRA